MSVKAFALAGAAGVALCASVATADFVGVSIEEFDGGADAAAWAANGHAGLVTYRLYADFDGGPLDGVISAFGIAGLPAEASSWTGSFYNDAALGGDTAPLNLSGSGIWSNQWDTYVTINATNSVGDATSTSPGFGGETNDLGADWSSENVGWFVTPDDLQSRAVDNRVLLGQFTVDAGGENTIANPDVAGTINLLLLAGTQIDAVAYSTGMATPAPGAMALLGLAGLAGTRRRRG